MTTEIDVTEPQLALTKAEPLPLAPPMPTKEPLTPAQARVDSVADVLGKARANASTLKLSQEEAACLKAEFPHEAFKLGAGGDPDLLYIEHAFLRDRFDQALGMCQWSLIRSRPHWAEEFTTKDNKKAVRLYADCALVIRGCLVAEAIGDMVYYPQNAKQNYGDAAEGSETAAFRRCAKKIGVGLQAWKKDFCEGWKRQARSTPQRPAASPLLSAPAGPVSEPPQPVRFDEAKFRQSAETWLESERVKWVKENTNVSKWTWAVVNGLVLPTEQLSAVTWSKLWGADVLEEAVERIKKGSAESAAKRGMSTRLIDRASEINREALSIGGISETEQKAFDAAYASTAEPEKPRPPKAEARKEPSSAENAEWFFDVIISVPRKGMKKAEYEKDPDTIGSLYHAAKTGDDEARKRLWGLAQKMDLKPREFNGKTYPPSEADKQTRKALDAFLAYEEAKGSEGAEQMRNAAADDHANFGVDEELDEPPFL